MEELKFNPVATEEKKYFANQMTPKEFAQYLLYLQSEGKLTTNITSANDEGIPNYITATFYYPTDMDYHYDTCTLKVWLTNSIRLDDKWKPYRYCRTYDEEGVHGNLLGWSTAPGEREFYQDVFDLYDHQDVLYRADLKNHWKKVQYPIKDHKIWTNEDSYGRKIYGKPKLAGMVNIYDFILAKNRHIDRIELRTDSDLVETKTTGDNGDCLIVSKNPDGTVKFNLVFRKLRSGGQNDLRWGVIIDPNKMMAVKPDEEAPAPKETSDGYFKEGDIVFATAGWETYTVDFYQLSNIDPETDTATLTKIKKEIFDSGKPYCIYKVYARPEWRYIKNKTPKLTDESFEAKYLGKDKKIQWEAPELKDFKYKVEKWNGGDVMVEWVDESG